jgi:putative oxidoreductase
MRILSAEHHPAPMKLVHFVHVAYARFVWLVSYLQSPLLLFIRLYWGWQFFESGRGKFNHLDLVQANFVEWGVPFPGVSVILAATTECVGGLLLMAGLASRATALALSFTMVVALLTADIEKTKLFLEDSDEFLKAAPLTFLFTSAFVLAFGPGVFSLDYLIKRFYADKKAAPAA